MTIKQKGGERRKRPQCHAERCQRQEDCCICWQENWGHFMEAGPWRTDKISIDNDGIMGMWLGRVIDWSNLREWLEKGPEEEAHCGWVWLAPGCQEADENGGKVRMRSQCLSPQALRRHDSPVLSGAKQEPAPQEGSWTPVPWQGHHVTRTPLIFFLEPVIYNIFQGTPSFYQCM